MTLKLCRLIRVLNKERFYGKIMQNISTKSYSLHVRNSFKTLKEDYQKAFKS